MSMKNRVVRVSTTEFEMADGRVYPHVAPLDPVPTLEEFQELYDLWSDRLNGTDVRPSSPTKSG